MATNFSAQPNSQNGFALLMTLILVGVLVSIGLSVLELSIKQVQLSTNARDSEIAFHAANAGMECSRYWRRTEADAMEIGDEITPACFGATVDSYSDQTVPVTESDVDNNTISDVNGEAFQYDYQFTWPSNDRCTRITTLVASSTLTVSTPADAFITIQDVPTIIPGYSGGDDFDCEAGARCTIISVRGYNQPCVAFGESFGFGTVEREVLLQF